MAPLLHKSPIKAAYLFNGNAPSIPGSGIAISFSTNSRGRLPENQGVINTGTDIVIMINALEKVLGCILIKKLESESIYYDIKIIESDCIIYKLMYHNGQSLS